MKLALLLVLLPLAAVAEERPRLPLSIAVGLDPPAGTGALALGFEWRGWGGGLALGLSDAKPGDLHQHLSIFGRAPLLRLGPVELAALASLARADRESEVHYTDPQLGTYLRWEWRPAYRLGLGLSARIARGAWAPRLDVGLAYVLNAPRCQYLGPFGMPYLEHTPCDDPRIPAAAHAPDARGRLTPWVALGLEYDLIAPAAPSVEQEPARLDGRETNAGLAPTALTLPAGSIRLTLYELLFPELAVGVTDRLQLSGGLGYLPPTDFVDLLYRAQIKFRLLDLSRLHLALTGDVFGYTGQYSTSGIYVGPGAVASVCLDEGCASLVSAAAWAVLASIDPDEGLPYRDRAVLVSPSAVLAVLPRVKLVAELHWAIGSHDDPVGLALVRIPLRHLIVEVGSLIGPFFPVGTLSWRF